MKPPVRVDRIGSLSRAFEFVSLLIGRERVTLREIEREMGAHRRTVIRYAHSAEMAGLIEWHRGKPIGRDCDPNDRSWVRLLSARLRRAA